VKEVFVHNRLRALHGWEPLNAARINTMCAKVGGHQHGGAQLAVKVDRSLQRRVVVTLGLDDEDGNFVGDLGGGLG
jgi:hypothetical protein